MFNSRDQLLYLSVSTWFHTTILGSNGEFLFFVDWMQELYRWSLSKLRKVSGVGGHHSNLYFRFYAWNFLVYRFAYPPYMGEYVNTTRLHHCRPLVASDGRHSRLLPDVVGPCLSLAVEQRSAAGACCRTAGSGSPPRPQTRLHP